MSVASGPVTSEFRYPKGTKARKQLLDELNHLKRDCTFALAWDESEEMILAISVDPASGEDGFFRRVPVLPGVEAIDMRNTDARASTYAYIVRKCPNLREIDLHGAFWLNDEALSHLARLQRLRRVIVGYDDVELRAEMERALPRWKAILGDRLCVADPRDPYLDTSRWKEYPSTMLPEK